MAGRYATDGSWNVTVVDGSTLTGLVAADGSINVVLAPGGSLVGLQHACGALNVTVASSNQIGIMEPDGSLRVSESPYYSNTQRVTAVSGDLTPGGGGTEGVPMGLLLALTYSA